MSAPLPLPPGAAAPPPPPRRRLHLRWPTFRFRGSITGLLLALLFVVILVVTAVSVAAAFFQERMATLAVERLVNDAKVAVGASASLDTQTFLTALGVAAQKAIDAQSMQFLFQIFTAALVSAGVYLLNGANRNLAEAKQDMAAAKQAIAEEAAKTRHEAHANLKKLKNRHKDAQDKLNELNHKHETAQKVIIQHVDHVDLAKGKVEQQLVEARSLVADLQAQLAQADDRYKRFALTQATAAQITGLLQSLQYDANCLRERKVSTGPAQLKQLADTLRETLEEAVKQQLYLAKPQFVLLLDLGGDAYTAVQSAGRDLTPPSKHIEYTLSTLEECQDLVYKLGGPAEAGIRADMP